MGLIKEELEKRNYKGGYVIDGFPRNKDNCNHWYDQLSTRTDVSQVIFLDVDEETMLKRIRKRGAEGSGRDDDNDEVAKLRFRTFREEQMPVLQLFDSWGLLKTVDASGSIDDCFEAVKQVINGK